MGPMVNHQFGDVVLAAGGTWTSKPRPVVVFQSGVANTGSSIIVIPLTTDPASSDFRLSVDPTPGNGLDRVCMLEIDKVSAIRTAWLGKHLGQLEPVALAECRERLFRLMAP